MNNEIENLKRQISAVQEIEDWYPLILDLLEFINSCPFSSELKVLYLKAFYSSTNDLMSQIVFDKNELLVTIETFKQVVRTDMKNLLIEFSDQVSETPNDHIEHLLNSIHKFERQKSLGSLTGEKLSEWEELLLNFYSKEIENFQRISTLSPFLIQSKNKDIDRKYNGRETEIEGFSQNRWALVLWYENKGSGIESKSPYYKLYKDWDDDYHRTTIHPEMKRGMKDKIGHYKWAVNHIKDPAGKIEAEKVLEDLEKQLIEIKISKK